jgi:hypothetical protein
MPAEQDEDRVGPGQAEVASAGESEVDDDFEPAPWHFKLLLVAFVLYLVYRGVQLASWGIDKFL